MRPGGLVPQKIFASRGDRKVCFRDIQAAEVPIRGAWNQCSSGHQHREARLVQNRTRDTTEHPLSQVGVAIGTHDEQIGTESGGLRKQKATHFFSTGRQTSYLHVRTMTRQVARYVRPWLLAMTFRAALMMVGD